MRRWPVSDDRLHHRVVDPYVAQNFSAAVITGRVAEIAGQSPEDCHLDHDTLSVRPYGSLISVKVGDRRFWYKANCEMFRPEAAVLSSVGRRFPDLVPSVVQAGAGWFVTRHVAKSESPADPGQTLESLARIQCDSVERPSSYAAAHAYRRLCDMPERLEHLLRQCFSSSDMNAQPIRDALDLAHMLRDDDGVTSWPVCLTHGDLHPDNVLRSHRASVLLDWSDAAWAHPLSDLGYAMIKYPASQRPALADGFRQVWAGKVAEAEMTRCPQVGRVLACLHQVETHALFVTRLPDFNQIGDILEWARRAKDYATMAGLVPMR